MLLPRAQKAVERKGNLPPLGENVQGPGVVYRRVVLFAALALSTKESQNLTISFSFPLQPVFSGLRTTFPQGTVVAGDFNGDGKPDLAVAGGLGEFSLSSTISVSLGNGDGTFRNAADVGFKSLISNCMPEWPLVSADFNKDGKLDLAVLGAIDFPGGAGCIVTYLGHGDGTFDAGTVTLGLSESPSYSLPMTVGDFNRDGYPDIIVGQQLLLGKGDGTFSLSTKLSGTVVASADFNGDGKPDVVIGPWLPGSPAGPLSVALGNGDGTFGANLPVGSPFVPGSFAIGDFNGDGRLDLAVSPATTGNTFVPMPPTSMVNIAVLPGKGDGTFQAAVTSGNAVGAILAAADFNRDGKVDLVVGNSILAGNGDGTFRFPIFFGVSIQPCYPNSVPNDIGCQVGANSSAVVADFNADGALDLADSFTVFIPVGGVPSGDVSILLNDSPGNGFFVTGVSSASYVWPSGATSIVIAFGTNLASQTATAEDPSNPPTTLGGIRVHLLDRVLTSLE